MVRPRAQWCSLVGSNFSVKSPTWAIFWLAIAGAISGESGDGLLFTRMIIGPVKNIERMINRWGKGVLWAIASRSVDRASYVGWATYSLVK